MKNRVLTLLLLGLSSPIWAALAPLADDGLSEVSARDGVSLDVDLKLEGGSIAWRNKDYQHAATAFEAAHEDRSWLVLDGLSGGVKFNNLTLDVAPLAGGGGMGLAIGMPSKIQFNDLRASLKSSWNSNPGATPLSTPATRDYMVVVSTAGTSYTNIAGDLQVLTNTGSLTLEHAPNNPRTQSAQINSQHFMVDFCEGLLGQCGGHEPNKNNAFDANNAWGRLRINSDSTVTVSVYEDQAFRTPDPVLWLFDDQGNQLAYASGSDGLYKEKITMNLPGPVNPSPAPREMLSFRLNGGASLTGRLVAFGK